MRALVLALLLVGCGGSNPDYEPAGSAPAATAAPSGAPDYAAPSRWLPEGSLCDPAHDRCDFRLRCCASSRFAGQTRCLAAAHLGSQWVCLDGESDRPR
jgi:hypothetical protein